MIGLIQRVKSAQVSVDNTIISQINSGILLLLGVEKGDTNTHAKTMANKVSKLRIFADANDKMNLSLSDVAGDLLVVSQFTLAADVKKGNRPGFSNAAAHESGEMLYHYFIEYYQTNIGRCHQGQYGANMEVSLVNDGPATFYLKI
ncbi:D-aminoacyl-tRNA deacylase [Glaciecola petra]|uniref:D-aminoacyl-tRNA deacylase n=1 Tax=Glaciecola petra TaxID=3075602 RepID=A0ABU2ZSP6_9ALTE|nr:D-aminoacyl-tRNA deacylase [Aestuariibacter sp. P117]MDT0595446.1 D-aminoacyl-tRNA deacylase [Aestuariibacter sp. P117]